MTVVDAGSAGTGLPAPDTGPGAAAVTSAAALARLLWSGSTYAARTVGVPAGLGGLAVELLWTAMHVSLYPWGVAEAHLRPGGPWVHHRTATLPPGQRTLVASDVGAATVPVVLVHGIVDNRSIFAVLARALRRRGYGAVHAVNYSPATVVTGDVRRGARDLADHVERICAATGAERVHVVGHSLGGLLARYYVQRLGGDARVDTLATLGTPHRGSSIAHLLPPTPLPLQLRPGSDLLRELEEPAPGCRTRFLAVWSRMDQLIIPQRNARLEHPDLDVDHLALDHVGHMSMTIDPVTQRAILDHLGGRRVRSGRDGNLSGCAR